MSQEQQVPQHFKGTVDHVMDQGDFMDGLFSLSIREQAGTFLYKGLANSKPPTKKGQCVEIVAHGPYAENAFIVIAIRKLTRKRRT
jgi:hypothetical protein